jgi:hypothetical protein
MPVSVENLNDAKRLANRPEPDWQGWIVRIRHQGTEWRLAGAPESLPPNSEIGDGR